MGREKREVEGKEIIYEHEAILKREEDIKINHLHQILRKKYEIVESINNKLKAADLECKTLYFTLNKLGLIKINDSSL